MAGEFAGVVVVAMLLLACRFDLDAVPPPGGDGIDAGKRLDAAPSPEEPAPDGGDEPAQDALGARAIRAQRVTATVIYAKEIHAKVADVGLIVEDPGDDRWEQGDSNALIVADEVSAHTIFAKEIESDWLTADAVYAKEVDLGDR